MHYVTHRLHPMQKHKFCVTCPSALFVETTLGPLKHEQLRIDVSYPGRTRMHYVFQRLHRAQKLNFDVMCPSAPFVESFPVPPEHEK
jgi:hypothetical protein